MRYASLGFSSLMPFRFNIRLIYSRSVGGNFFFVGYVVMQIPGGNRKLQIKDSSVLHRKGYHGI